MRQITDSDIEYLNSAESGPLDFIGWSQWHLRLNFEFLSIELMDEFRIESGGKTVEVSKPYTAQMPLGGLFGQSVDSFRLETGNVLAIRLSDGARISFDVRADRPYEQCVVTVHRRALNDNMGWIVI
jgi:hypothetical protein